MLVSHRVLVAQRSKTGSEATLEIVVPRMNVHARLRRERLQVLTRRALDNSHCTNTILYNRNCSNMRPHNAEKATGAWDGANQSEHPHYHRSDGDGGVSASGVVQPAIIHVPQNIYVAIVLSDLSLFIGGLGKVACGVFISAGRRVFYVYALHCSYLRLASLMALAGRSENAILVAPSSVPTFPLVHKR